MLDHALWKITPEPMQDEAVQWVAEKCSESLDYLRTQTYSCGGETHRIASYRHKKTGIELALLPGGTYTMGRDAEFSAPAHPVTLERPFFMGHLPVLQWQWDKIGGGDERTLVDEEAPIDGISLEDVDKWLLLADGLRLPSEAEWEYACRAGTRTKYFWGDEFDGRYCWCWSNSEKRIHRPREHATFRNAFGLVDMLGNLSEYCSDTWFAHFKNGPYNQDALVDHELKNRPKRGGGHRSRQDDCFSFSRLPVSKQNWRYEEMGFRVVLDLFE